MNALDCLDARPSPLLDKVSSKSATMANTVSFFRRKNSKLGSYVPAAVQPGSCKVEQFRV
jgi:hypothetical protein